VKVTELISKAYYLSEIVARDLETVNGSQSADGLDALNSLLAEKTITGRYIPYYTHVELDCVIGQEEYSVSGLVDVSTITFNIDQVRYSLIRDERRRYFGSGRVDNITTLPKYYCVERALGASKVYLYPLPAEAYNLKITGKFSLNKVDFDTELSDTLDDFYVSYLTYLLANRLCQIYPFTFPPDKKVTLDGFERKLGDLVTKDFTINKKSILNNRQSVNYGQVNLGHGWTTP